MSRLVSRMKSQHNISLKRKMTSARGSVIVPMEIANRNKYTTEELQEYKEVFSLFDKDGSGSIGYVELEEAMYSLGLKPSKAEIQELIKEVDVDGNGEIDFDEFCLVMEKMSQKKDTKAETIRQCFEVFDQDGDGSVHEKEFRQVCVEIGGFTEKMADDVFQEADVTGNGRLDYDEFAQMAKTYLFSDEDSS